MITSDGKWEQCDIPSCREKIKNYYWARVKAKNWYFTRGGRAFCPTHKPYFKKVEAFSGL